MKAATKEEVKASLVRFVREFGRYPTRQETREYDYLYSQLTVNRYLGIQADLGILEEVYKENPKRCLCCSNEIPFEKRHTNIYCSHSCSATATNKVRSKKAKETIAKIKNREIQPKEKECIYCLHCQNVLLTKGSNKFCSLDCGTKHRQLQSMDDWLKGNKASVSNRVLRGFLKELDGNNCSICGIEDWNGKPIVFEVEHKDGNSEDSSRENVCLICPNCHSQTDTYKGKNRGNGRHKRRERYIEGKSY